MTATVPATEPTELVVGDRWQWTRDCPDQPASAGWALTYYLVNATSRVTLTTTGSGATFTVDQAPANTAAYVAGDYDWQAVAAKTGDRAVVASGRVRLLPNYAALGQYDGRSQARKALDDAKAAFAAYTASRGTVQEYEIAGRRMRFRDADQIIGVINFWKAELWREEQAASLQAGLGSRRRVYVRVGRA